MEILHAFWHPDPTDAFARGGRFRLWVETDLPPKPAAARKAKQPKAQQPAPHPFALPKARWPELLETFGSATTRDAAEGRLQPCPVWLPSSPDRPLPSPELAHRLGEPVTGLADAEADADSSADPDADSDTIRRRPWQVETFPLEAPLRQFRELRFLTDDTFGDRRAGPDLLFWHWLTQALKQLLLQDQYLPGLRYRQPPKLPRRKSAPPGELHPVWQWAGRAYEQLIEQAVPAMPAACAAGSETPLDPASVLAHCAAVLLDELVRTTPLPATFEKRIDGSLIAFGLKVEPGQHPLPATEGGLALYREWRRWRQAIDGGEQAARFTLGFRLLEPDPAEPEQAEADADPQASNWTLELIVIPRDDPSQRLPLADYWDALSEEQEAFRARLGDADFERHLLLDLGLAARIYPKLWDGMATAEPQALALSIDEAFDFLKDSAWVLESAGYKVVVPAWWTPSGRRRAKLRLQGASAPSASSSETAAGTRRFGLDQLLQYRYALSIGDEEVSPEEWEALIAAKTPLVRFRGEWVELDRERMAEMLAFWQRQGDETVSLSLPELLQQTAQDETLEIDRDSALAEMLERLSDDSRLELAETPAALNATLRDYQRRGLSWIGYLEQLGMNGCLADDMGLGKTLQVIAQLVREREDGAQRGARPGGESDAQPDAGPGAEPGGEPAVAPVPEPGPTLLVAPTSVLGNWQREVQRFAPQLSTHLHHGPAREQDKTAFAAQAGQVALVITSYALARKDAALLSSLDWHRVVLDEAQNIKNPKAAQTKAVYKLPAPRRLALTGTPVENRLGDLWSLFEFLQPGYLGTRARFRKTFELPVQRDKDPVQTHTLKQLVQPFILRRVKTDKAIISDLPDKLEAPQYCQLSREQGALYESLVRDVEQQLEQVEGSERSGLMLSTLMKLKQICNHPAQFLHDGSPFTPQRSNKLQRLQEMLEETMSEGDSVLVFTQFTEIGEQLERLARQRWRLNTFFLHGGTPQRRREAMIAEFQDPASAPSLFILSLKAGGVGITLTKANHVFHFDRWWNPAVEDQASDRAYRIGQEKTVFVHKFVTLGTLEERIDAMIEEKKAVAGAIIGDDESWLTDLDNDRFKALIRLNREAVGE
ncbi:DEAD/DEAH box helicase [Halochromatium glycolicum]|uniref:ATP-dependent helicase n=1 Tax=Halochromatium glycolicum TaxID=85075 RepID=A0AAJ0X997_9GAMM|nr:DEAD/DEAH box helicase [Halochromatium glycolicum]MBK1704616.1 ATP-dependent helicase [Halochromatium glycolicum]